ncbi:hypothetical protein SUGI_1141570 [Cryptomeria japonica]|uniref:auxin-responsive protein SAUR71 n=1 Tax=Cryptomeria japonica TaxID=3369 RepID=UPI00241485D6|nr:auxin-responsive protein SAUR71 [Cryptomeria japonica]GLJ53505.1 hypothetical protein SUGI_1141570 [Cryptomeria japonica]
MAKINELEFLATQNTTLSLVIAMTVVSKKLKSFASAMKRLRKGYRRLQGDIDESEYGLWMEVPKGYVPLYVGKDEVRRFMVDARLLNHPFMAQLLQVSREEYGYQQKGGLVVPCDVLFFQTLVDFLTTNDPSAVSFDLASLDKISPAL